MRALERVFLGLTAAATLVSCDDGADLTVLDFDSTGSWAVETTSTGAPCDIGAPLIVPGISELGGLRDLASSGSEIAVEQTETTFAMREVRYSIGAESHEWNLTGTVDGVRVEALLTHTIEAPLSSDGPREIVARVAGTESLSGRFVAPEAIALQGEGVRYLVGDDPILTSLDGPCSPYPAASYRVRIDRVASTQQP